jgi:hypothetical protein
MFSMVANEHPGLAVTHVTARQPQRFRVPLGFSPIISAASLRVRGKRNESSSDPFSIWLVLTGIYWISGLLYDVAGIILKFQTGSQSQWLVLGLQK